jgi:hypothetical protein
MSEISTTPTELSDAEKLRIAIEQEKARIAKLKEETAHNRVFGDGSLSHEEYAEHCQARIEEGKPTWVAVEGKGRKIAEFVMGESPLVELRYIGNNPQDKTLAVIEADRGRRDILATGTLVEVVERVDPRPLISV